MSSQSILEMWMSSRSFHRILMIVLTCAGLSASEMRTSYGQQYSAYPGNYSSSAYPGNGYSGNVNPNGAYQSGGGTTNSYGSGAYTNNSYASDAYSSGGYVAGGFATNASATSAIDDALNTRLMQLEEEVRQLRAGQFQPGGEVNFAAQSAESLLTDTNVELANHELYQPSCIDSCFGNAAASKYPTVRTTGFFHLDGADFNQNNVNKATMGDLQNGLGFRRARFGFTGNVTKDVSYMLELDFGQTIPLFVDVWMNFANVPVLGNLRIGRWRQPFGMSELTSVRELAFLERSTLFTYTPFRQTGIGFYNHSDDERATWAVSGFRYPSNQFGNNLGDSGGWAVAGRATLLPVYLNDGDQLVHLGVDYMFADPSQNVVQYASQPEIQIAGSALPPYYPLSSDPAFVNTGAMPTRNTNTFGLEAAGALGNLYVQSEARWASVRMLDGSTQTFPGAYAMARYILTGEKLPYNKTGGVFGRVVPDDPFSFSGGGLGAWELAARWSYIDLNGVNLTGPGRRLNDLTFGVNWYLNQRTKFQFNYIQAFLNDPTLGKSTAGITAVRAQVDF